MLESVLKQVIFKTVYFMFIVPCILVILVYKIPTRCNFFCLFGFFNSTCFGRSLHPSSRVIYKL